ncbi:phosphate/phosphite/phosphonate ABC transporter substrate-binding protein [Sphingomonas faeni]|uniref:phosphate/phosphite/phosphonate ABC transporter substrate-binding protein n=1 Tax=Sphingomonas faeni TaxID=185950 RepID=UPI003353924F
MTRLVASLGMYDHPAQQGANDRIWSAIVRILRTRGVEGVPDVLDRARHVHDIWRDPNLLFGQACGYPLVADESLALLVIALPVYDAPGSGHGHATHASVLVARANDGRRSLGDYRDTRPAINDPQSNTGMNLFRATLAPIAETRSFFATAVQTGSHRASVVAVVAGDADIAAIDTVSYAALIRHEPDLTAPLKIVARSPASPTLPFVTSATTSIETIAALRLALQQIMTDPHLAEDRAMLGLAAVLTANADALAPIRALEQTAIRFGYPDLL